MKNLLIGILVILVFPVLSQEKEIDISDAPLITLNEDTLTRESLVGKILVLNFWFMSCGPCLFEIPELNKLSIKYKDNTNVKFIAISSMDEFDKIGYFISRKPFNYEHISKNKSWIDFYKIKLFPTNIVINKKGKIVYRKEGYLPNIFHELNKEISNCLL